MRICISCCFCDEKFEADLPLPEGWVHRYDEISDDDQGFCPKHQAIADFAQYQCPGCVSSWGSGCPLWHSFAYSHARDLTTRDFETIERGICPRRVNGTIGITMTRGGSKIEDLDLSDRAPAEAGAALAEAIKDYCARYPAAA